MGIDSAGRAAARDALMFVSRRSFPVYLGSALEVWTLIIYLEYWVKRSAVLSS